MGVFHVFWIVQMVPNRATHHSVIPGMYQQTWYCECKFLNIQLFNISNLTQFFEMFYNFNNSNKFDLLM